MKSLVFTTAVAALIFSAAPTAQAQSNGKKTAKPAGTAAAKPKTSAKPKPPVKSPAKPTGPIVLGTTQMAGDFGKLGTTYTIGTSEPINFTLERAEYSVEPVTVGTNTWVPTANQKLLVLHYSVHNPLPREQQYHWGAIRFTAVDARDTNQEYIQAVAREGEKEPLSLILKPAQKVAVTAAILVPAEGIVPKLIVERERGAPVIRYDLHGNVAPLPKFVAENSDTTGASALKEVPAAQGVFYPLGIFDTRLDEVSYVNGPLLRRDPGPGNRWVTAVFTIKNRTNRPENYTWSSYLPDLRDADGEKARYQQALLKATRDEINNGVLAPGEEGRIRFFFAVPEKVNGKVLRLAEGKQIDARVARVFAFDLSSGTAAAAPSVQSARQ